MTVRASFVFAVIFTLTFQSSLAQQSPPPAPSPQTTPAPSQPPPASPSPPQNPTPAGQDNPDEVVRITTNLVQIDAVVTDSEGRQVTDLRAEDFEILENTRPRTITNFSYISLAPDAPPASPTPTTQNTDRSAPIVPPARPRPEQVRRTVALVVDDLGLSFESAHYVREALRRFVNEQMQPGDLAAIIRTSAGGGALGQFTADRRQLAAAIERVRWRPASSGTSATEPIFLPPFTVRADADGPRENRGLRREMFAVGALGTLNYVVGGLRRLPGRKSVVFFSDGFPLVERDRSGTGGGGGRFERRDRVTDALERVIDAANRASVVIYSIDARGVVPSSGLTAADDVAGVMQTEGIMGVDRRLNNRRIDLADSQESLDILAESTGGLSIRNNDLAGGLRRALDDGGGYYLLAYRPDAATFGDERAARRFNNLRVRVRRPGLRVRTRSGFYAVTDDDGRRAPRTRAEELIAAINSPLATDGVRLRLTSLFGNDARRGSFLRSMLHLDARDLTFAPQTDGWHEATMDVLAVTLGADGRVVDEVNRTETVRVRGATYERIRRDGFVYFINVPVRQPGAYQLRVAVRDRASARTGSASQFVEVPRLDENRLALSGLIVIGPEATTREGNMTGRQNETATEGIINDDMQTTAAVRRFQRGMFLDYGYEIYNAQTDRATRCPQLTTQLRLFRDGRQIFTGQPRAFETNAQPDARRLRAAGRLTLGRELVPGEYVLQIIVTDALARNERHRTASAWIDFEITR